MGRGGATTFSMDLQHSDAIMIMGSNMAECHPVAFRWPMKAKAKGAKIIHVDPRFTRTSAMANIYAPLRAGSDIVFLGALVNYIINSQRWNSEQFFKTYVTTYTNAPTLINADYKGPDDLEGLFSGWYAQAKRYTTKSWAYQTEPAATPTTQPHEPGGDAQNFAARVGKLVGPPPIQDRTLQDPQTVFQIMKRHYARYTPELVEQVCGTPKEVFIQVAETLLANSGPDKTSAICYAVGWTQHTVGVQLIRTSSLVQLLLGNIGRPGGGILALRGHATIQGSTDIATLYNLHPGYLNTPSANRKHDTLVDYIETETTPTAYWSNFPKFIVSQLKAWYGDTATKENSFGYDWLPKIAGDYSHMPMFVEMSKGNVKGMMALGQNPAVGGQNAGFQRKALAKLEWLVVRDLFETETASFWKDSPEVKGGELNPADIQTEVFFLPAAAVPEMDGSFTNTQRVVQWHEKAADPPGDARSDIWFTFHLGRRLKELYAAEGANRERDWPIRNLVWDYVDAEANRPWRIADEPSAALVLKEINGYDLRTGDLKRGRALDNFGELRDDGTTACGGWIYTGVYAGGRNHAADQRGDDWVSPGWAFSWPDNRRILYNRASADPQGRPWPKEARLAAAYPRGGRRYAGYVYWDADAGRWVGLDSPDFPATKRPDAQAQAGGVGLAAHDGASPFIMKGDGKGWLYVPTGLVDGPLPTHYEPYESPVQNVVYPKQQRNPV